jgi:hypothetical protein
MGIRLTLLQSPYLQVSCLLKPPICFVPIELKLLSPTICLNPLGGPPPDSTVLSLLRNHSQLQVTHRATLFVGEYSFLSFVPLDVGTLLHLRSQVLWYAGNICFCRPHNLLPTPHGRLAEL